MTIKRVKVEDAVGMVLAHDMTKIVPGQYKGPAFKKGHIVTQEDIPLLKDIGKEHINLIELTSDQLHENQAIERMSKAIMGSLVYATEPQEGRINIKAGADGLLKVNERAVTAINMVENAVVSTLHSNTVVKKGTILAGVKVVPLVVEKKLVEEVETIAAQYDEIIKVLPLQQLNVGVVITGNEVYYGRIKDRFAPVFIKKLDHYGANLQSIEYLPDEAVKITQAIIKCKTNGADIVIAAGGMSVDADDVTAEAIRKTGADVVTYGTPVLPGAMFMLAYLGKTAVIGMPACGMYAKVTVFDCILPRVLANDKLTRAEIAAMGYGGLCRGCSICTYPQCAFGK